MRVSDGEFDRIGPETAVKGPHVSVFYTNLDVV